MTEGRLIILKGLEALGKRTRIGRPRSGDLLVDRVELALLIALGKVEGSIEETLKDRRDFAAFLVISDLRRRNILFRVEYPLIVASIKGSRYRIYPLYVEDAIEDLEGIDLVAVTDLSGDVVYYKIEETSI